jgi:hypothetical protein
MMFYGKKKQFIALKYLCIAAAFFIFLSACDLISPSNGDDENSEPQDESLFGTYDSWTYVSGSGWTLVPDNQLIIGTASLKLNGVTLYPTTGVSAQELGINNGQIWVTTTANNTTQTAYVLDYFLQDATAYGIKILWVKSETTTMATLTTAPAPSTATANSILCFIPVGAIPSETPPATKSLYALGFAGSSMIDVDAYYWKDNVPTKLTKPSGVAQAFAINMYIVGSDTYITGIMQAGDGTNINDGYWENGVWMSMTDFTFSYGEGSFSKDRAVFTESDIYLIGKRYSTHQGGYYRNGVWYRLPGRTDTDNTTPLSITIDNGDIYIVGTCKDPSISNSARACYWKNDMLVMLDEISGQKKSYAQSISIYGSDIRIAGDYQKADNSWVSGWWKNGTWSRSIKASISQTMASNIIKTTNGTYLGYIVSHYGDITGQSGYSFYDIATASFIDKVLPNISESVVFVLTSMTINDTDIYASGVYSDLTGQYLGGYWKNTEWNAIALPESGFTISCVCSILFM